MNDQNAKEALRRQYPHLARFLEGTAKTRSERRAHAAVARNAGVSGRGSGKIHGRGNPPPAPSGRDAGVREKPSKGRQGRNGQAHLGRGQATGKGSMGGVGVHRDSRHRALAMKQGPGFTKTRTAPGHSFIRSAKDKSVVGIVKKCGSLKEYHHEVRHGSALNSSNQWRGENLVEYESYRNGQRQMRVRGSTFIGQVSANTSARTIGERLSAGLYILAPSALGGRLELLAQAFEEHELMHARIVYRPVVSATTEGAIAIYFRNDVGASTVPIGLEEMTHASTHTFVQTQVWEPVELPINPQSAMNAYFDAEVGEYRMETQGVISIEAASDLSAGVYGDLYFEYEFEFRGASLDYEVADVETDTLTLTWDVADVWSGNEPVVFSSAAGTLPIFTMATLGGSSVCGDLWYGVVDQVTGTLANAAFHMPDHYGSRNWTVGQGFWFRFFETDSAGIYVCVVYGDLASASAPHINDANELQDQPITDGSVLYVQSDNNTASGSVVLSVRNLTIDDQA